ncbi:MAG TPA: LPS export ABC transporter periplasmic protein LptC [Pseudomonadales bacterium]|nr:LPS export ABC transporter periplasmic protein LptC [Pseudomonadales bacterium]
MLNNWRQLLGILAILVVAVAGLTYRWQPPAAEANTSVSAEPTASPDMVMQQPLLETFDDTGKRSRQVSGQDLMFFSKSDQALIALPSMEFQPVGSNSRSKPWQLKADTALLTPKKDSVYLQGSVILWNDNTRNGRTEIRSETLRVDTLRQFAETDKTVTIRGRRSEVRSTGLQADLTSEHLLLTSRVKEIHEVSKHP